MTRMGTDLKTRTDEKTRTIVESMMEGVPLKWTYKNCHLDRSMTALLSCAAERPVGFSSVSDRACMGELQVSPLRRKERTFGRDDNFAAGELLIRLDPRYPWSAVLDAEAEIYILLVAGVGVEIVGGAAVELVALAQLAADEQAQGDGSESGRNPADGL